MPAVDPKNRMNDLDSRTWLQFQKSWFLSDNTLPLDDFISFFTKSEYPDGHCGCIALYPVTLQTQVSARAAGKRQFVDALADSSPLDYAFIDLRDLSSLEELEARASELEKLFAALGNRLQAPAYLTVACRNWHKNGRSESVAWALARLLRKYFNQKDEKIGCASLVDTDAQEQEQTPTWQPANNIIYFLQFRNDFVPDNGGKPRPDVAKKEAVPLQAGTGAFRDGWFIHKPPPRSKQVLLHPAKFPEDLVQKFIETFTEADEWVFDPMAGTGSSLVAALEVNRRACGIELNPEFVDIARTRYADSKRIVLVQGDARDARSYADLPSQLDYCITSPPYWDMLRMRGAETQAKRKAAGLQRWYSDDPHDLGNITEYDRFLDLLEGVYRLTAERLRPGRYMTIIVKNVKKKGEIYPLSWDIADRLQNFLIFCGEQFWCQDDQRLAPFGYRYAWVSNTFHHYCLTFQKPL